MLFFFRLVVDTERTKSKQIDEQAPKAQFISLKINCIFLKDSIVQLFKGLSHCCIIQLVTLSCHKVIAAGSYRFLLILLLLLLLLLHVLQFILYDILVLFYYSELVVVCSLHALARSLERARRSLIRRIDAVLTAAHAAILCASYMCWLWRIYPAVSFAEAPLALPLGLVFEIVEHTCSMLNIIFPLADESVSAGPDFGTSTFHLSSFEFAVVNGLVGPSHLSFALHIVVFKLALVEAASVRKIVLAESMELTIDEVTFVVSTFELKPAFPGLFAFDELASKLNLIVIP